MWILNIRSICNTVKGQEVTSEVSKGFEFLGKLNDSIVNKAHSITLQDGFQNARFNNTI